MTAKAHAEFDLLTGGVRIALAPRQGLMARWRFDAVEEFDETTEPPADAWLRLGEDSARAVYEALGRHFGGSITDARMLRKDYDAERVRVDRMIDHLTKGN